MYRADWSEKPNGAVYRSLVLDQWRTRLDGVAGPDGGTDAKPVGRVHLCVIAAGQTLSRAVDLPGSRSSVRQRTLAVAMHMIRSVLT